MQKITLSNFEEIKNDIKEKNSNWIKVGMSTCGIAAGADETYKTLKQLIEKNNINVDIIKCGCVGMCYAEPLVEVKMEGTPQVVYGKVDPQVASSIVEKHILGKSLVNDCVYLIKE